MVTNPKTTIWENTFKETKLIKTKNGLPSPIPKQGESVYDPEYGNTVCAGITCSGSGNEVTEVKLNINT